MPKKIDVNKGFSPKIIFLFVIVIMSCTLLIVANVFTIKALSGARAYVYGESMFSKAQKEASRYLSTYLHTGEDFYWQLFLTELKVPHGDHMIRVGMNKGASHDSLMPYFIEGKNHPDDLKDVMWLYENFRGFPVFAKAIREWESADTLVFHLRDVGNDVNKAVQSKSISQEQRSKLLDAINTLSDKLTVNQYRFSNAMGEGSRAIKKYLIGINIVLILFILSSLTLYYFSVMKRLLRSKSNVEKTNEDLRQVNEELDRFVYSASHDLRSPITAVMGLIQLAEGENDISEIKNYLSLMQESVERQDQFIKDILDYSRNSRKGLEIKPIVLSEFVDAVVAQHLAHTDKTEFKVVKKLKTNIITTDELRLKIILNNLISNAVKYADNKKVQKQITVNAYSDANTYTIEVKDNGKGIKRDVQGKVFDMFFVTDSNMGSGLGLYIAKQAVESLNGTIEINSKESKETTFTVTIPKTNEN